MEHRLQPVPLGGWEAAAGEARPLRPGGDGEMFGETRLEELVVSHRDETAEKLQRTIVDAVLAFSGAELEDDLTLVVVGAGVAT